MACAAALAATHRPAWYQPAAIDYNRLHEDKVALAALEEQISAALNAGNAVHVRLDEHQVNRWLTASAEIWPGEDFDFGPLAALVVHMAAESVRIGGLVRHSRWAAVVSVAVGARVSGDELRLHVRQVRVGALALPARWALGWLRGTPIAGHVTIDAAAGEIVVRNSWVWPNGKRRFRLREVKWADGALEAVLEPL